MDFDEFANNDDDFNEFDSVEPEQPDHILVPETETAEGNIEVKIWLMTTLVFVIVLHSFSDKWISWVRQMRQTCGYTFSSPKLKIFLTARSEAAAVLEIHSLLVHLVQTFVPLGLKFRICLIL